VVLYIPCEFTREHLISLKSQILLLSQYGCLIATSGLSCLIPLLISFISRRVVKNNNSQPRGFNGTVKGRRAVPNTSPPGHHLLSSADLMYVQCMQLPNPKRPNCPIEYLMSLVGLTAPRGLAYLWHSSSSYITQHVRIPPEKAPLSSSNCPASVLAYLLP
jgi:hypothetical protein